jgi:hypothetical protein
MYEHYIGHRICWRCIVSKATPDEKRPTRANLELIYLEGQMNRHLIRCSVAAKKYPQLKDSTRPLYVQLFGRIQKITEETIDLTDVHLNFVSMVV